MESLEYGLNGSNGIADATMLNSTMSLLFMGMVIFSSILSLIMIISLWKIFTKGNKPGWASLIPFYNMIVLTQIADLSIVYFILLLVPIVQIYAIIKIYINIAKKFGKSSSFAIGLVFIPIIFFPILAFSDEEVKTPTETNNNNFNPENVINNKEEQTNTTNIDNGIPTTINSNIESVKNEEPNTNGENVLNSNNKSTEVTKNDLNTNLNVDSSLNTVNNNLTTDSMSTNSTNLNNEQVVDNNDLNTLKSNNVVNESNNIEPVVLKSLEEENAKLNSDKVVDNTLETNNLTQEITNNEPIVNNNVNAFNQTPIVKPENLNINNAFNEPNTNPVQNNTINNNELANNTETVNQTTTVDAFNQKPELNNEVENLNVNNNQELNTKTNQNTTNEVPEQLNINSETTSNTVETLDSQSNINLDIPTVNTTDVNVKKCKNCGNEMPSIVSVCPNCGTDNE